MTLTPDQARFMTFAPNVEAQPRKHIAPWAVRPLIGWGNGAGAPVNKMRRPFPVGVDRVFIRPTKVEMGYSVE